MLKAIPVQNFSRIMILHCMVGDDLHKAFSLTAKKFQTKHENCIIN